MFDILLNSIASPQGLTNSKGTRRNYYGAHHNHRPEFSPQEESRDINKYIPDSILTVFPTLK